MTSDEAASIVGSEKKGGADELVWFAEALGGSFAQDRRYAGFIENLAVLFRGKETWHEGIDSDVLGGPFAGEVFGEVVYSSLRGRVAEDTGEGVESGNGAEVDDGCWFTAFDKILAEDLTGLHRCQQVDVENMLELLFLDLKEGSRGVDSCTIDEDVDLAGSFDDSITELGE